jgi:hypothetical protein
MVGFPEEKNAEPSAKLHLNPDRDARQTARPDFVSYVFDGDFTPLMTTP